MIKRKFLLNGLLLTAATLATRTMGMVFMVYMSKTVGSYVMGLYQLVITIYFFTVTFVTGGISLTVTRLITEELAKGNHAAKYITKRCMAVAVALSVVVGAAMFLSANYISKFLPGENAAALSLKVLAPSLPFVAVSCCVRGYFYAVRQALPTAGEQLIEQITKIIVFVMLTGILVPCGAAYACLAIAVGTSAAEAVSAVFSYIAYCASMHRKNENHKVNKFYARAAAVGVPITLGSSLRSGLNMAENSMIPGGLKRFSGTNKESLCCFGEITGMAIPLMVFPSVILFSFSMLIIPELSEENAKHHIKTVQSMASSVIRFSFLFSVPVASLFFFFGKALGAAVYDGSDKVGAYIVLLAPLIPLWYLDFGIDGMLKGLNQQLHYLWYNIADSLLRVVLIAVMVPQYGIRGLAAVLYISAIFNTGISLWRLVKTARITVKVFRWIVQPLLCAALPCFVLSAVIKTSNTAALWLSIGAASLCYVVLMRLTKGFVNNKIYLVRKLHKSSV